MTTSPGAGSLGRACERCGLDVRDAHLVGGYESVVYEVPCGFLRLTSSGCRTHEEVAAELAWVSFLAQAGVPVARPAREADDAFHVIDGPDGYVTAVLFERAPGRPFGTDDWSPERVRRWGELLATMHALARDYTPPSPRRRKDWSEDVRFRPQFVPASETAFHDAWHHLTARLAELPVDAAHHGLIHADVGPENMMIGAEERAITLFDFADSIYSWFAHDLACSISEARIFCRASGRDLPPWFVRELLEGYRRQRQLEPDWEARIDDFLKLQELERFIARHRVD